MLFWILLTSPDIARISDDNAVNDAPGGVASMMDRGRATLGAGPGVADPLGTGPGQWEPAPGPAGRGGATMARGRTPAAFGKKSQKSPHQNFLPFSRLSHQNAKCPDF
jgi:hypothetical protein